MIRIVTAGALLAALGNAPLQCGHNSSDPNLRREDDSGDALYALAQDFRAKGNDAAAKDTLRFLVEHYPSNRHATAARAELGGEGAADPKTDASK
jgi:Tfp pilus assembly protein PilF